MDCGPGITTLYFVRVSYYIDWILKTISSNEEIEEEEEEESVPIIAIIIIIIIVIIILSITLLFSLVFFYRSIYLFDKNLNFF